MAWGRIRKFPDIETFLTLVIALGGIATGIGAIWAEVAARRQTQVTERSLAEQNERARLTLEYDMLSRLGERTNIPHFLSRRRAAANYLLVHDQETFWAIDRRALGVLTKDLAAPLGQLVSGTTIYYPVPALMVH